LCDDLDLSGYLKLMNAPELSPDTLFAAGALIGIDLSALEADIDVAQFVERRLALIREKNWAEADRIREELAAQGIQLKDGKDPGTGERVTTWEVKR
ncbi:MAG: cysteine--tRNA ligase, partial [Nitratireductor sp.]